MEISKVIYLRLNYPHFTSYNGKDMQSYNRNCMYHSYFQSNIAHVYLLYRGKAKNESDANSKTLRKLLC